MKNNKKRYWISFIIGLILLFLGILSKIFFTNLDKIITITLINTGLVMIITSFIFLIKKKEILSNDERIKKIDNVALNYSWISTFITITILFWVDYFKLISLNTNQILSIIFFIMIISANFFKLILSKKGDV